jgi:hypothetical protein
MICLVVKEDRRRFAGDLLRNQNNGQKSLQAGITFCLSIGIREKF